MNSCIREDSLPEIESLQRAICLAYKMTGIWCDRYHTAKSNRVRAGISYVTEEEFAFGMYMHAECIEDYLREHCEHLGLNHKFHEVGKPCSIAGEEFLDKIWDSKTNNWREGGAR